MKDKAQGLIDKLTDVEGEIYQHRLRSGQDPLNYPIRLNNKLAALQGVVESGDYRPTDQSYAVFKELSGRLDKELSRLDALVKSELATVNKALEAARPGRRSRTGNKWRRIAGSSHGESRLRMLRMVRRGDRHDPRDLTISFRFEGEFSAAFLEGRSDILLPGEAIKNLVHSTARRHGAGEIETPGAGALCRSAVAPATDHPRARRDRRSSAGSVSRPAARRRRRCSSEATGERRTAMSPATALRYRSWPASSD